MDVDEEEDVVMVRPKKAGTSQPRGLFITPQFVPPHVNTSRERCLGSINPSRGGWNHPTGRQSRARR